MRSCRSMSIALRMMGHKSHVRACVREHRLLLGRRGLSRAPQTPGFDASKLYDPNTGRQPVRPRNPAFSPSFLLSPFPFFLSFFLISFTL